MLVIVLAVSVPALLRWGDDDWWIEPPVAVGLGVVSHLAKGHGEAYAAYTRTGRRLAGRTASSDA